MKLSKLGLWLLAAYLLWAAFWYVGYRNCLTNGSGGLLGCNLTLIIATLPLSLVVQLSSSVGEPGPLTLFLLLVALCCVLYYALGYAIGAWIGWLRRLGPQ